MTEHHPRKLVAGYLQRLESASAGLARGRRTELVAEIRGHIDDALLEAGAADEVTIRNVLERLGPPEEIAPRQLRLRGRSRRCTSGRACAGLPSRTRWPQPEAASTVANRSCARRAQ